MGWVANFAFAASNQVVAEVTIFGLIGRGFVGGLIGLLLKEKRSKSRDRDSS